MEEDPENDTRPKVEDPETKCARRGGGMTNEKRAKEKLDPDQDVEAQLLKESLGAGLAAAAIFAGSSQAASYPVPGPPGSADAAAKLAPIPKQGVANRAKQQARPRAKAPKKALKAKRAKNALIRGAEGGGRT
jgi:hypothetical protein